MKCPKCGKEGLMWIESEGFPIIYIKRIGFKHDDDSKCILEGKKAVEFYFNLLKEKKE